MRNRLGTSSPYSLSMVDTLNPAAFAALIGNESRRHSIGVQQLRARRFQKLRARRINNNDISTFQSRTTLKLLAMKKT